MEYQIHKQYILLFVLNFMLNIVYNYLDPGSGSIIAQAIIGALIGVGISVKVFWYKIKEKITRNN